MSSDEIKMKCLKWEQSGVIVLRALVQREGYVLNSQESLTSLIYKLLVIDHGGEAVHSALLE